MVDRGRRMGHTYPSLQTRHGSPPLQRVRQSVRPKSWVSTIIQRTTLSGKAFFFLPSIEDTQVRVAKI